MPRKKVEQNINEEEVKKNAEQEKKVKVEKTEKTEKKDEKKVVKKKTATSKSKEENPQVKDEAKEIKDEVKKNKQEENTAKEKSENKLAKKNQWISLKEIKKTMKEKQSLPKEESNKINKYLFQNIMVAIAIIVYFIFLNLGKQNIQLNVYVTDLKVFGMCILLLAIMLLEKAYKDDSGRFAVFGIEMIVLSLTTISLIYVSLMLSSIYSLILTSISYIFAIYYLIKSVVIYLKKRKKYFVDGMKKIIKDKEEE